MNIRFEYLYRDAGNFKRWGEIVFSNPGDIGEKLIASMAEDALIDSLYFVASKARIPDLHFSDYNEQLDHDWHEMHEFQPTTDVVSDSENRTIDEFLESLRYASMP